MRVERLGIKFCHPLLPLSIFPSIRGFSNESLLHIRWPKYWTFSITISPSNEYSGLISFRINCFNLLAVQRTLKSLLQHRSSKASTLWRSAFFMVQFSQSYVTKEELPRSLGAQYAAGDQWRNNSRKNEGMEPKQKQHPVVDVTGDRSKIRCCKE